MSEFVAFVQLSVKFLIAATVLMPFSMGFSGKDVLDIWLNVIAINLQYLNLNTFDMCIVFRRTPDHHGMFN